MPGSKDEADKATKLVSLGYPAVEPVLGEIFEWVEDANWPVAKVFLPFLARVGAPLVPHVRYVLQSQDEQWKRVVLDSIVSQSGALAHGISVDLLRLIDTPTAAEQEEGLHTMADALFQKYCSNGHPPN
ncbi:MAG: DUF5071 domain-containing protein [Pseudomonadota bacterium]